MDEITVAPAPQITLKKPVDEFMEFVHEQGVIGLAAGFIIGAAIGKVVSSIATDIIQPIIGYIFDSTEGLAALHPGSIMYDRFLANVVDFLIMAAVVFYLFKKLKPDKLDAPK